MAEFSLPELRELAAKRHRAVTDKISRTRRRNGAELAGTEYDPRRQRQAIARMSRRQLQATIKAYNQFTARSTQFVGDANRAPISKQAWDKYKAAEAEFNKRSAARFDRVGQTEIPGSNMTAAAYRAKNRSEFPGMADAAVNDPYANYNRKPYNVNGQKGLDKLTKEMRKRATAKDFNNKLLTSKEVANEMLDKLGADEFSRQMGKLNAKQFEWLWNVSPFAKSLSLRYHSSKPDDEGPTSWVVQVGQDQEPELMEMLNAARKIK
jgi:hypothetical protein